MALNTPEIGQNYDSSLLQKAKQVADRLLPAFDTPTGLPYGTVGYFINQFIKQINLLKGVAPGESEVVCTACAGTFSLEFTWLSLLTGDAKYEVKDMM